MNSLSATPGMVLMTVAVVGVQLASLLTLGLFTREFHRIVEKRAVLIAAIQGKSPDKQQRYHYPLIWIYVCVTAVITGVTTWLYVFEPHLL